MTDYEIIKTALEIARSAHEGQKDKAGEEYICLAIAVKKADLTMNMDLSRIPKPTAQDLERIEKKYKPALSIIENH